MNTPISNLPTNGAVSGHILTDVQVSKRKREEAKQALLDLHSHGFTFTQIVNQGLNPALLRTLYAEVGIQITSPSPPQLPQSAAPGADSQTSVAQEKNHTALSDLTSNSPITTAAKDVEPLVTGSTTVAAPKKSASNNLLAKPSAPKATISKPLDRKEYIARMLAAKAGKPTVNTNLPVPPKASATMTPEVIAPPPTSSAATIPSVPAVTHMDPEPQQLAQGEILGAPPPSLKDDADAEAKRKAKTDLARQKIEALRLQQETRKVTNRVSTHQSPPASSGVNIPAPVVAPITVPRPPVPSRQSSYFSPVNQKAPFNIPGLFMTAEPSHSVKPFGKEREQSSVSLAGALQKPSFDLEPSQQPPPTRTAAPASEPSTESKPEATSNTAQRKRQKAADFLDSPSTRIKRPLGQQENYSVIIDISDDEMADASEIDSEEVETLGNRVPASKKPQPIESAGGWQRPLQDLPPLSDIPSRKTLATITPVAAMPTQTKGLKTTEMEIELMNRKIAELEQRVNAKKTISRAQTPGPLASTTASPPLDGMSKKDHDASNATSKSLISNRLSGPGRSRQASLDSIGRIDTADAEQKLHEVERAKAEAERSLVADVAQASDQERVLQKDPPLAAQNEVQVTLGTDGQSLERVQMREVEQEQLHDRLPPRNRSEELSRLDQLSHLRDRDDRHRSEPEHFHSQDEEKSRLLNEQRRTRRLAIKSGLPVLDATVDKTKQKLESLKQEIEDLELEVKKGIEGRKALVEELERLSQPSATKQHTNEPDVLDIGQRVEESLTTGADQGKPLI